MIARRPLGGVESGAAEAEGSSVRSRGARGSAGVGVGNLEEGTSPGGGDRESGGERGGSCARDGVQRGGDSECGWVGYLIVFLILACTLPLFIVPLFYMDTDEHRAALARERATMEKRQHDAALTLPVKKWDTSLVVGWLQRQQLGSATGEFVRQRIDGAKLLELASTPDHPLLAVFNRIQKKKFLRELEKLNASADWTFSRQSVHTHTGILNASSSSLKSSPFNSSFNSSHSSLEPDLVTDLWGFK